MGSHRKITCRTPGQLEYGDEAIPTLESQQLLLQITHVGICGTDIHAFEGNQPYFEYPRILGHEIAAKVADPNGSGFDSGQQVTLLPYFSCGSCFACRTGKPNCCQSLKVFGVHIDGGMRDFVAVPAANVIPVEGLSPMYVALIEPLAIAAHAIRRANIAAAEFVLIMGAGPIGLGLAEFARIAGATVIILDTNDARLQHCSANMGYRHSLNPAKTNALDYVTEFTGNEQASVVIDATGNLAAINSGLQYLSHAGRYVLVGLQKESFSFSHPEFHKRETSLLSSRNATEQDFEYVIRCLHSGQIQAKEFISASVGFGELGNLMPDLVNSSSASIKTIVSM